MSTDDPTYRALLAGVLAEPADDTARLVYADWLEENGQPERAEFIRAQCALVRRWPNLPADRPFFRREQSEVVKDEVEAALTEGAGRLRRAEQSLFHRHWREWAGDALNDYFRVTINRDTYDGRADRRALVRRGFVAEVTCPAAGWLAHGDAICAAHPIERVTLTTRPHIVLCAWGGTHSSYCLALDEDGPVADESEWVSLPRHSDTTDPTGTLVALLARRWPRVRFDLPPAIREAGWDVADASPIEDLRRYREMLLRGAAVPPAAE